MKYELPPIGTGMMQQWLRRIDPELLLPELSESGVEFIEMYLAEENWEDRERWLRLAREADLFFTFHAPYVNRYDITLFKDIPGNEVRKAFTGVMELAAELLSEYGLRSRLNLHGATDLITADRAFLYDITVKFLNWLAGEREKRKWPLDFVIELLPHNGEKLKIGERAGDLVALQHEIGGEISGFCWDFGHYRSNVYQQWDASLPEEFLSRVRHAHIHDFKSLIMDVDHCPLIFGEVPYRSYLSRLGAEDLFLVLELNYRNSESCGDPKEGLMTSIRELVSAREEIFSALPENSPSKRR